MNPLSWQMNLKYQKRIFLILEMIFLLLGVSCKNDIPAPPPLGPEWRAYNRSNSPIASNIILCMTVDNDGSLWFGTDYGATHFIPSSNSWTNFSDSIRTSGGSVARVVSITQAKDRAIWFGTTGGGAIRFNPTSQTGKAWTRFSDGSQVPFGVPGITADKSDQTPYGEVWVASSSGIDRFTQTGADQGSWQHFDPSSIIAFPSDQFVNAVTNPINYHIWFGAAIGGSVEEYYDNTTTPVWGGYESPSEKYKVKAVAFDLSNNVWFGKEIGASKLNLTTGHWTYFTPDSTNGRFPGGAVNAIETDYHTTRWFGTDSGLVQLDDTMYTHFTQDNSALPNNRVSSVKLDLRGNLWIGTQFGVAVYKKGGTQF